jgi:hypothetical protein
MAALEEQIDLELGQEQLVHLDHQMVEQVVPEVAAVEVMD